MIFLKRSLVLFFVFVFNSFVIAQELNANVSVNADRITDVSPQIFQNLETKVREFLNNTKFTSEKYEQNEKIECVFFFNISKFSNNNFEATLQVQSSRPIFNSTYTSPVLNVNDVDVSFRFLEFEQLIYDQNSFTSNLVSILSFYANVIIGLDKDTYSVFGGTDYLSTAANITTVAQSSGYSGWSLNDKKNNNRYFLITDLLSNTFKAYRNTLFIYHFNGLDIMNNDIPKAKEIIADAIQELSSIQNVRPNALLTRTFFDAKADELVQIFSGGPNFDTSRLRENLMRISPLNASKWSSIR